jgi:hypothetical protein
MRTLKLLLPFLLLGCGAEGMTDEDPLVSCDQAEGVLGTGLRTFEAVTDGDVVWLYRGPQGGYMLYLSVRARGLDPSDVHVDYVTSFTDTGEVFGEGTWNVRLHEGLDGGWTERVGIWGTTLPAWWDKPGEIRGRDATVRVTVTDKNGCQINDLGWDVHISAEPGT